MREQNRKACEATAQAVLTWTVLAREKVLLDVLEGRLNMSDQIKYGVQSTTNFAYWDWEKYGIEKLARGTLRKFADQALSDKSSDTEKRGWRYLDDLRKAVKGLAVGKCSPRSKIGRSATERRKVLELATRINSLEVSLLSQSKAYLSLLQQVRGLAKSESIQSSMRARLFNILNNHDELFGALFGPGMTDSVRPDNVEALKR